MWPNYYTVDTCPHTAPLQWKAWDSSSLAQDITYADQQDIIKTYQKAKRNKTQNNTIWRDRATSEPDWAGMLKLSDWGYKTTRINMLKSSMDNYEQ